MLGCLFFIVGTSALGSAFFAKLPNSRVHHLYRYAGVAVSILLATIFWLIFSLQSHESSI